MTAYETIRGAAIPRLPPVDRPVGEASEIAWIDGVLTATRLGSDAPAEPLANGHVRVGYGQSLLTIDAAETMRRLRAAAGRYGEYRLMEPGCRFRRALMRAMADVFARLRVIAPNLSDDHALALRLLAQERAAVLRPDMARTHEDLIDLALAAGFAAARAFPLQPDPGGLQTAEAILSHAGLSPVFRHIALGLLHSTGHRYFGLLGAVDRSAWLVLWLSTQQDAAMRPPFPRYPTSPPRPAIGVAAPCWRINLTARASAGGVAVTVDGWCLVAADAYAVRVTLDGVSRLAAIEHPRPDVHDVVNRAGLYPTWNALCAGLGAELHFGNELPARADYALTVEILPTAGDALLPNAPPRIGLDQAILIDS